MFTDAFFDELEKLAANILTNGVDVIKKRWKEDVEKPKAPVVKTAFINPMKSPGVKATVDLNPGVRSYRGVRAGVRSLGGKPSAIGGPAKTPKPATFNL